MEMCVACILIETPLPMDGYGSLILDYNFLEKTSVSVQDERVSAKGVRSDKPSVQALYGYLSGASDKNEREKQDTNLLRATLHYLHPHFPLGIGSVQWKCWLMLLMGPFGLVRSGTKWRKNECVPDVL